MNDGIKFFCPCGTEITSFRKILSGKCRKCAEAAADEIQFRQVADRMMVDADAIDAAFVAREQDAQVRRTLAATVRRLHETGGVM